VAKLISILVISWWCVAARRRMPRAFPFFGRKQDYRPSGGAALRLLLLN
jgi:hypothetical protein